MNDIVRRSSLIWLTFLTLGCSPGEGSEAAGEPQAGGLPTPVSVPAQDEIRSDQDQDASEASGEAGEVTVESSSPRAEASSTEASAMAPSIMDASDSAGTSLDAEALLELLEQAAKFEGGLYQQGETVMLYRMGGSFFGVPEARLQQAHELWFEAPRKLRLKTSSPAPADADAERMLASASEIGDVFKILDGESLYYYYYYETQNSFFKTELIDPMMNDWSTQEMAIVPPDLIDLLRESYDLVDEGAAPVEGRSTRLIRAIPRGLDPDGGSPAYENPQEMRFWVAQDDGRVVQTGRTQVLVLPDEVESVLGSAEYSYDMLITTTLRSEIDNPDIEAGLFEFVPPPDAKRLEEGWGDLGPLP